MIMNRECKLTVALVVAIFVAAFCAFIIVFNNIKLGVIPDLGTFVGVCVGLIGICATIMVGLQIWNHIEFREVRSKVEQIDAIRDELLSSKQNYNASNIFLSDVIYSCALSESNLEVKIMFMSMSIRICFMISDYNMSKQSDILTARLTSLKNTLEQCNKISGKLLNFDKFNNLEVPRNLPNYFEIMKLYTDVIMLLQAKLKQE